MPGRPLLKCTIRETAGSIEYCVEREANSLVQASWLVPLAALAFHTYRNASRTIFYAVTLILLLYTRSLTRRVQSESLRLIPPHGIQIETRRGCLKWTWSTERHFIPSTALSDVFIHEGLHGWNVLYYLAVCYRDEDGNAKLRVAFENILPQHDVLLPVYKACQETMFRIPKAKSN